MWLSGCSWTYSGVFPLEKRGSLWGGWSLPTISGASQTLPLVWWPQSSGKPSAQASEQTTSSTYKEDQGICTHCYSPTESSVARVRINQYNCLSYSLRRGLTWCIVNVRMWGSGRAWFCVFNKVLWSASFPQLQNLSWVKITFRWSPRLRDKKHIQHVFIW